MIYLDSAALVKLVHAEPESPALRAWLGDRAETPWVSSVLVEIESFRALARYAPEASTRLYPVLDQIDLIDLSPRVRILAQTIRPVTVRTLDAIHLGTALSIRRSLTSFAHIRQAAAGRSDGSRIACRFTDMILSAVRTMTSKCLRTRRPRPVGRVGLEPTTGGL